jgi:hypothetical protein
VNQQTGDLHGVRDSDLFGNQSGMGVHIVIGEESSQKTKEVTPAVVG